MIGESGGSMQFDSENSGRQLNFGEVPRVHQSVSPSGQPNPGFLDNCKGLFFGRKELLFKESKYAKDYYSKN